MSNRLHRDLVTLRRLLEESTTWRLRPDQWRHAARVVDDLARHLVNRDAASIDAVLRQFEEIAPGSRAVTRIDDPRSVPAPEPLRNRIVEIVPLVAEQIERSYDIHPRSTDHKLDAGDGNSRR